MNVADVLQGLGNPTMNYANLNMAVGSANAGLMLAQLIYWDGKQKDAEGWIYKTQSDFTEELGISRYEQETARKKLRKLGILEELKKGLPAKLHYRINKERLQEVFEEYLASKKPKMPKDAEIPHPCVQEPPPKDAEIPHTRMRKSHIQGCGNPPDKHRVQQETTSETTKDKNKIKEIEEDFSLSYTAKKVPYFKGFGVGLLKEEFSEYLQEHTPGETEIYDFQRVFKYLIQEQALFRDKAELKEPKEGLYNFYRKFLFKRYENGPGFCWYDDLWRGRLYSKGIFLDSRKGNYNQKKMNSDFKALEAFLDRQGIIWYEYLDWLLEEKGIDRRLLTVHDLLNARNFKSYCAELADAES